ncbi:Uncharacterised protein [Mycolicibacterium vanbaalenii]|uniref:Sulfocyanin (SoxE) n=1 Tax=Mycolicibacterium vanbaalenii TaxID=110539 RepID=A0A5S9MYL9_MYCVN|nr:hypothetical protein [Mycolicibacterium vanbaalenii]CAA0082570.1 Uncharacterised protein [Mycolicibacterium vanbaalenii]
MATRRLRLALLIGLAAVVLGVASTFALAATVGPGIRSAGPGGPVAPRSYPPQSCEIPPLPGTVVDVNLTDTHGSMMGPRVMHGQGMRGTGPGGPYGPATMNQEYPWRGMRMMSMVIDPATVPAGEVSFRVLNTGAWIHELTVLPLGPGESIGQRRIEASHQVDESAGLGHVEASCGAGEGEGLVPGAAGWTTIALEPGRYELICNIAGHYWAGMYTELTVTG